MRDIKRFVIGAQCAGKTTAVRFIRENLLAEVDLVEMDEEIMALCGGQWPSDDLFKEETLVPQVLAAIAARPNVILLENHMSVDRTLWLKENGFDVVLIEVPRDELLSRNKRRMIEEGYDDAAVYIDSELAAIAALAQNALIDRVVSGLMPVEDLARQILAALQHLCRPTIHALPRGRTPPSVWRGAVRM